MYFKLELGKIQNCLFMSARTLFNIIIKVMGIYFIKDIVISLPYLFQVYYDFANSDMESAFSTMLVSLAWIFIYILIMYFMIFRTDFIIDRLRLIENIQEDPIPFNVHRSTVYSIVTLLLGLFLIVYNIPLLVRELIRWYQFRSMTKGLLGAAEQFDYSLIMVYVAEIVIGLLLIGNLRIIVSFIESRQKQGVKS